MDIRSLSLIEIELGVLPSPIGFGNVMLTGERARGIHATDCITRQRAPVLNCSIIWYYLVILKPCQRLPRCAVQSPPVLRIACATSIDVRGAQCSEGFTRSNGCMRQVFCHASEAAEMLQPSCLVYSMLYAYNRVLYMISLLHSPHQPKPFRTWVWLGRSSSDSKKSL